jgi:hypothetical protein
VENLKVEKVTLEDGRLAERHTSVRDDEKVTELFVEEKKPLKLEKRLIEKHKQIVSEQRIETIKDGEVVDVQIKSLEPIVPLQLREHIGVSGKSDLNANAYVTKDDLRRSVADAVVAGFTAMYEKQREEQQFAMQSMPKYEAPIVTAQEVVENRVETKAKNDNLLSIAMGVIIAIQVVVFVFINFLM